MSIFEKPCRALLFYTDLNMLYLCGVNDCKHHIFIGVLKGQFAKEAPVLITPASGMERVDICVCPYTCKTIVEQVYFMLSKK